MFIELVKDDHVGIMLLCAETRSWCQACMLKHVLLVGTQTKQHGLLIAFICIVSIDIAKLLGGLQRTRAAQVVPILLYTSAGQTVCRLQPIPLNVHTR